MALTRKVAHIDLTSGNITIDSISVELRKQYIGGRGLDIYFLFNQLKKGVDSLSPDNLIVLSAGLLGGTLASAAGWTHMASKSALSGFLGSTNIGEFFAPELRWAGFDHLVITGRSPKPSYIFVHNGKIKILNASKIWGKTQKETHEILREETDEEDIQSLSIGPGGEKLVRFATVATRFQQAGGRTGIGAVWGSKNLKAIAARGTLDLNIKFPKEALEYDRQIVHQMCSTKYGNNLQTQGTIFPDSDIPAIKDQGIESKYIQEHLAGYDGCSSCQLHCRERFVIDRGPYAGSHVQNPGHRNVALWETGLASSYENTILAKNYLTDFYGLDPQETASLTLWAMKLYEKGILTSNDLGGLKPDTDEDKVILDLIGKIGRNEGIGNTLAEGGFSAAQKIGKGSEKYLAQVRKVIEPDYDRLVPASALSLATATSSSDHILCRPSFDFDGLSESELRKIYDNPVAGYTGTFSSGELDYESKAWQVFWHELLYMAADMIGMCKLHTQFLDPHMPGFEEFSRLIYLNTGLQMSPREIWDCANRAYTAERLFNIREGYKSENDLLPDEFFVDSSYMKNNRLDKEKFKAMLNEYYKIHDWDENGEPKPETLRKLGLDKQPIRVS